jgi:hypothetical protein
MASAESIIRVPESARECTVMRHGLWRTYQVFAPNSADVLYTSQITNTTTKNRQYDLTLHDGDSNAGPTAGAARFSIITNTIKLASGDPDGSSVLWEDIRNKPFARRNVYSFSIELPTGERRNFEWKGTHDVKGISKNIHTFSKKMEHFAYNRYSAFEACRRGDWRDRCPLHPQFAI